MAGFPWSELGMDGPADERAIRRAYASRLKVVRPDVDAAGFQRLVHARDVALRLIERDALQPQTPPSMLGTPLPKREEPAAERVTHSPDSSDQPETRTQAPKVRLDLGTLKSNAGTDAPEALPPVEPSAPVEIDLSAPPPSSSTEAPPPQSQPPADVTPPRRPSLVTEPEVKPPLATPAAGNPALEAAGPDAVSKLLSAFVDAWSKNLVLPPVAPILKQLGEESIVARERLEVEALRAVAALLDKDLFDRTTPTERQKAARSLILGLDDDYAWTNSDRRLYTMMPPATADQIGRLLRAVREWENTGLSPNSAPPPPRRTAEKRNWAAGLAVFACFAVVKLMSATLSVKPPGPTLTQLPGSPGIYNPVVQSSSNLAAPFFDRGVTYDNAGQIDRAIEEYDQAIGFDPEFELAFYNRGLDYAKLGKFDRAIQDYDAAIRLNPASPDSFVSRGVAHDGKGQYDRAIQDYDRAIRLKPGYVLAFVDRGIAYANKDQYDRAIQDYDQALRLSPNDPDALYNRGVAKRAKGDITGGDADIAMASTLQSASPQATAGEQTPSANAASSSPATAVKQTR